MNIYRSLIYREFRLTRKRYLITLLMVILLGVLLILPCILDTDEDYDEDISYENAVAEIAIFTMMIAAVGGVAAGTNNGVQKSDISCGWKRYSYALPYTSKQKTTADLIVKSAFILAVGAVCMGVTFFIQSKFGYSVWVPTLMLYLAFIAAAFFLDAAYSYIILLSKDEKELKKNAIIAFFAAGLVIKIITAVFGIESHNDPASDDMLDLTVVKRFVDVMGSTKTIVITAVLLIVSIAVYYIITWKSYERREQ